MSGMESIVIFGASGDLTRRKLIPSLFYLYCKDRLPENWRIVGVARTEMSDGEFRDKMEAGLKTFAPADYLADKWVEFAGNLYYQTGNLQTLESYHDVNARVGALAAEGGERDNRIYYLAVAPHLYEPIITHLGQAGMVAENDGWRRVVIEKPFGRDLPTARALNRTVHQSLDESQIYRIDHYLGKETVQNILVFRFANSLFEPVWNRNYIDHVQITAAETVDVEHRAGYYDNVGVVRDMVQNHMLQLLSLVAIEPPTSFEADATRNEKVKLFAAIRHIEPDEVARFTVRGQYRGYREAAGVQPDSETATFVALELYVDNWRWHGVPFYLRSGKALAKKTTEISILFKRPPHMMFPNPNDLSMEANELSICIQPDEGIHFSFQAKVPDTQADMRRVDMSFHYGGAFGEISIPDAYERLLVDVLKGDASLFTRGDAHELAWELVDKIIAGWESDSAPPLVPYDPGSWGPAESTRLIAHEGYSWSLGCERH